MSSALKRDQVVELLRNAILEGEFQPGERLVEMALAKDLGVSQTPVREALVTLETEGLVVKVDHLGTFVASVDQAEFRELLTLRAELEGYCARLAAERGTPDELARLDALMDDMTAAARAADMEALVEADLAFHDALSAISSHGLLRKVLTGLRHRMRMAVSFADAVYSADLTDVARSHRALADALRRGDASGAEAAARQHVLEILDLIETGGAG